MPMIKAADGTHLHVLDWGKGPTILFIHGWPLSAHSWEYQMVPLAERGFRCVAYCRRGFGMSDKPWGAYNYDVLADDLKSVIDGLNLDAVTLAGFSMGGGEVVRYMSRHQGAHVKKCVLIASVVPFLLKSPANSAGVEKRVFDDMRAQLREDRPAFLEGFGKTFFGAGLLNMTVSSAILGWAQHMALQASPQATIECIRSFSETDFRGEMGAMTAPTLIIHGDADKTVPIATSAQEAAKMIAGSQLVTYNGAPHGLFYTERERLNDDLASFVA